MEPGDVKLTDVSQLKVGDYASVLLFSRPLKGQSVHLRTIIGEVTKVAPSTVWIKANREGRIVEYAVPSSSERVARVRRLNRLPTPISRETATNPKFKLSQLWQRIVGASENDDFQESVDPSQAGNPEHDFILIWDPEVLSEDEYADLVVMLGDLARSHGAIGVFRKESHGFGARVETAVLA